jgi:hypothetical protein
LIHNENESKLIWDNACYHSIQNLLPSWLSKKLKTKIHRAMILPVVLYGYEAWGLTLNEEEGLNLTRGYSGRYSDPRGLK